MSIERIHKCIGMMKNARNLAMAEWQQPKWDGGSIADTIEGIHNCGNTACFAGYLAVSKFFLEDGGEQDLHGRPVFDFSSGHMAVAKYLGISEDLANGLVHNEYQLRDDFYGKPLNDVEPQDVIDKLHLILKGELK